MEIKATGEICRTEPGDGLTDGSTTAWRYPIAGHLEQLGTSEPRGANELGVFLGLNCMGFPKLKYRLFDMASNLAYCSLKILDKNRAFVIPNAVTVYHSFRIHLFQNRAKIICFVCVHPRFGDHAFPKQRDCFCSGNKLILKHLLLLHSRGMTS